MRSPLERPLCCSRQPEDERRPARARARAGPMSALRAPVSCCARRAPRTRPARPPARRRVSDRPLRRRGCAGDRRRLPRLPALLQL